VEAVIDKDLGAVLLGQAVAADVLVIATDVDHAVAGWGTPQSRPIGRTTPSELRRLAEEGHFASGSMGPKVDAVCRFVEKGGPLAVITSLNRIDEAVTGEVGTAVHPD
jgi:carbamate kinase